MKCRFDVIAEQREEACDSEGLVAIAEHLPVDGTVEVVVGDEGDDGVNGNHGEDTDDVFLFPWSGVVSCMPNQQDCGHHARSQAKGCRYEETDMVECDFSKERILRSD